MENLEVLYLTIRSIEECQPKQTKSSKKLRNKKSNKINKNKLTAKTLEAFTPKAKIDPLKNTYFKNMLKKQFWFLKLVQYYICNNWKKFIGPWRSINSKNKINCKF